MEGMKEGAEVGFDRVVIQLYFCPRLTLWSCMLLHARGGFGCVCVCVNVALCEACCGVYHRLLP